MHAGGVRRGPRLDAASDVWHAHCVKLDDGGIACSRATGTGVAHCPCVEHAARESGIAPVRAMRDAGVPVGLGVDGSASNDAGHLVAEARMAMLLQRVGIALEPFGCDRAPAAMTARDALELATRGGARVLGRTDVGHLAPGMCADLALFDLRTLAFAGGAVHDPVGALVLCAPPAAAYTIVNGKIVVREGRLASFELEPVVERHNELARELVERARRCS